MTSGLAQSSPAGAPPTIRPLVSIVVPVYNAERWVAEALDSILGQTYQDLEVLVLDDASTDGSREVIGSFRDPRLRSLRNASNLGQFENVNAGIRLAKGELVAVHHADDVYEPELIAEEVAYLDEVPAAGAVFALDTFIDPDGVPFGRLELPREFRGRRLLTYAELLNGVLRYGNTILRTSSSLVRRDVYERVGLYDPRYRLRADLDMWLRIARAYPIGLIDRHLFRYRWGHENVSSNYERHRVEPELTFSLLDERLRAGDFRLVEPEALAAFEGRRAEDQLIVATNLYTLDRRREGRTMLARTRLRTLLGTRQVKRPRLVILWAMMQLLLRLPRLGFVAHAFDRRWAQGRGR
jgi:teichuronic acid biosynthesis glycosyltransferase TuaG